MIPAEAAHDTIAALGELGLLQFKDLNTDKSAFQRTFASQIKRCDEMARQLRFLTDETKKAGIPTSTRLGDRELEFDELESRLASLEQEILELNANSERLNRSYNELLELQLVLERAAAFFDEARASADAARSQESFLARSSGPTREGMFPNQSHFSVHDTTTTYNAVSSTHALHSSGFLLFLHVYLIRSSLTQAAIPLT